MLAGPRGGHIQSQKKLPTVFQASCPTSGTRVQTLNSHRRWAQVLPATVILVYTCTSRRPVVPKPVWAPGPPHALCSSPLLTSRPAPD